MGNRLLKDRYSIFLFIIMLLALFVGFGKLLGQPDNLTTAATIEINVGACGTLTSASNVLDNDVSGADTCIEVGANNVQLDCLGRTIRYDTDGSGDEYGVDTADYDNFSLLNCVIIGASASGSTNYGIYVNSSNYTRLINNTIHTNGTSSNYGISLWASNNSEIINNTIWANGSAGNNFGINLDESSNTTVTYNQIYTNGTNSGRGIYLQSNSDDNWIAENHIIAAGSGTGNDAIQLFSGAENTFLNNNLTVVGIGVNFWDSSGGSARNYVVYNNSFADLRWEDNGSGGFLYDLDFNITNELGFGHGNNLFLAENIVAINISAIVGSGLANPLGLINSSAQLTFYNLGYSSLSNVYKHENYTTDNESVVANGSNCLGSSCTQISVASTKLIFNTTGFSAFSVTGSSDSSEPDINGSQVNTTSVSVNDTVRFNATISDAAVADVLFDIQPFGNITATASGSEYSVICNATNACNTTQVGVFNLTFIFANDTTGNENKTTDTLQFNVSTDLTPPIVNLEDLNYSNSTSTTFGFSFNYSDLSKTANCSLYLNNILNESNQSTTVFTSTTFSIQNLSNGNHSWFVNCTDPQNNTGQSAIFLVAIDSKGPAITPLSVPAGANLSNGTVSFNYTVTDAGHHTEFFYINITNASNFIILNATNTSTYWNASINVSTITEAPHTVELWANDSVGNLNQSESYQIIVDRTPPNVTLITEANTQFTTSNPSPSFSYVDSLSPLANCTLEIEGTELGSNPATPNNTATSITTSSALAAGTYIWQVNCSDGSGNTGSSAQSSFIVTAPAASSGGGSSGQSCPLGEIIKDGFCQKVSCVTTADCPQGTCINNVCVVAERTVVLPAGQSAPEQDDAGESQSSAQEPAEESESEANPDPGRKPLFGLAIGSFGEVVKDLTVWWIGGVILVGLIAGGLFLFRPKPPIECEFTRMDKLERWLSRAVTMKATSAQIAQLLKSAGWNIEDLKIAQERLKSANALRHAYKISGQSMMEVRCFVQTQHRKGVPKSTIISALIKKGSWDARFIGPYVEAHVKEMTASKPQSSGTSTSSTSSTSSSEIS